jgi:hypothetical protein
VGVGKTLDVTCEQPARAREHQTTYSFWLMMKYLRSGITKAKLVIVQLDD